jgi:major capsid protein gp7
VSEAATQGWICSAEDARHESWMSDTPWLKANDGHAHRIIMRHKHGVSHARFGMSFVKKNDLLRQLFYGRCPEHDEEFTGLAAYYNTTDPTKAQNAVCVLDAGGGVRSALTSMWVMGWGPNTVFMVTPDGLPLAHSGEVCVVPADFRFVIRIANVDLQISKDKLDDLLCRAIVRYPSGRLDTKKYRPVIYMNADLHKVLGADDFRGKFVREMPITNNEALVI